MTSPLARTLESAMDDAALLQEVRDLLASDAFVATFQTMGGYRTFLLQHIRNNQEARRILAVQPPKLEDL